jgi:hypothetical protein
MDASALAKEVFEAVRPAIGAYGTAALTRDEDDHAAKQVELGRAVLQEIYWRDKNVPPLETAVTDFAAGPQDEDAASGLRIQIRKVLEADGVLSAEVEKMLRGESSGINAEADKDAANADKNAATTDPAASAPAPTQPKIAATKVTPATLAKNAAAHARSAQGAQTKS